ncbi:MAG: DUF3784 domain-containing protein [Bacteroidales bacterium]|nr:DUF3784 domain-containing protein [Bacteroidales bacterium]
MGYTVLASGLVLIIAALVCYRYPDLINPYGGLPPERKALVDIDGLKKVVAIVMASTGFLLVITATLYMLKVIDEDVCGYLLMGLGLAMMVPLFIAMKKYNGFGSDRSGEIPSNNRAPLVRMNRFRFGMNTGSKAYWKVYGVLMGLTLVFVVTLLVLSSRPQKIMVGEEAVKISGMYGSEIPIADIVSVELLDEMPASRRINGSELGDRYKGHFQLKSGEKCMVFIRKQAPYIEMRTNDNLYYINADSGEETKQLYQEIKDRKK